MAIGMISKGTGFGGLLSYLLDPSKRPTVISGCLVGIKPIQLAQEFRAVSNLRPRVTKPVRHISIGFAPEDGLVDALVKEAVALRVLNGLGYQNCQYLVIDHHRDDPGHDSAHEHDHIHIVTSAVSFDGEYVRDSFDRLKIQPILRELEKEYGLKVVLSSWESKREKAQGIHLNSEVSKQLASSLENCPNLETWLDRLGTNNIDVRFNLTYRGVVRGVTYIKDGQSYKGVDVGASWQKVEGRFSTTDDDLAQMLKANEKCDGLTVELNEIDRALFDRSVAGAIHKLGRRKSFESRRLKIQLEGDTLTVMRIRPHKVVLEAERTNDGWKPVGFPNIQEKDAQLLERVGGRRSGEEATMKTYDDDAEEDAMGF